MIPDKILIGILVMLVWLLLVYTKAAPVADYIEMLKAIMAGAVLIHMAQK